MSYASRSGRARTSLKKPEAFAVCDRCGIWYNLVDTIWQFDWRGSALQNLWLRVCRRCLDVPQEQLRAIILPADPVPVWQPRVEDFVADETNYRALPGTIDPVTGAQQPGSQPLRITDDNQNRITQPMGCPDGLVQDSVMPYNGGIQKAFGLPLAVLSIVSNGTATVSVTCSKAHGLTTNDQVAIDGMENANGFYSVNVVSATAFTYMTAKNVPAASLLTPTGRIITALVGLPYGSVTIPKEDCTPAVGASSGAQFVLLPGGQAADVPGGQGILVP